MTVSVSRRSRSILRFVLRNDYASTGTALTIGKVCMSLLIFRNMVLIVVFKHGANIG